MQVSCLAYSSSLRMEATSSSETLVHFHQITLKIDLFTHFTSICHERQGLNNMHPALIKLLSFVQGKYPEQMFPVTSLSL
jgi:hypothetical protein